MMFFFKFRFITRDRCFNYYGNVITFNAIPFQFSFSFELSLLFRFLFVLFCFVLIYPKQWQFAIERTIIRYIQHNILNQILRNSFEFWWKSINLSTIFQTQRVEMDLEYWEREEREKNKNKNIITKYKLGTSLLIMSACVLLSLLNCTLCLSKSPKCTSSVFQHFHLHFSF